MKKTLKINKHLLPFLSKPQPIKVAFGGRGSGKSIGLGDIATFRMETEGADIYCLREFQDSVNDSVHRVITDSVEKRLKLKGWDIQRNTIIAPNGAKTTYKGANRNPDSMQSAQGYKYSWFEEAHRASQESLDKLLPTILRNPGAQCWFSANPQSSADPFSQRFIVPYLDAIRDKGYYEDDIHYIVKVNWRNNPWWNDEQEKLRAWDYEHMPRAKYDWIWEGEFNDGTDNAIVQPEWFDSAVNAHEKLGIDPTGARITSFDPADEGEDAKAYASRKGILFDDYGEIEAIDGNVACDEAIRLAIHNRSDLFVWDGDGMGALLRRQVDQGFNGINIQTRMYKGSNSVDNPDSLFDGGKKNKDTFYNKRAQYYILLAERFRKTHMAVEHGKYMDPDELVSIQKNDYTQKLRAEVCGIPKIPNLTGKIQLMSKKDMKKQLQRPSPNMADCLAMALETPETDLEDTAITFEGWAD